MKNKIVIRPDSKFFFFFLNRFSGKYLKNNVLEIHYIVYCCENKTFLTQAKVFFLFLFFLFFWSTPKNMHIEYP